MSAPAAVKNRKRASSVTDALRQIPLNNAEAVGSGAVTPDVAQSSASVASSSEVKPLPANPVARATRSRKKQEADFADFYKSRGLWNDIKTGRWMLIPTSSLVLLLIPILLYLNHEFLRRSSLDIIGKDTPNPFEPLIFPSYRQSDGKYIRGYKDCAFIAYYIIFFSFTRQATTMWFLRPLAKKLGVKGSKIERFCEQGYAVCYFGVTGPVGIAIMRHLPTWWYKTEHFYIDMPHTHMDCALKCYYLMQFSYWFQQGILLAARIEKPRKDFKELIAHHFVTLWLIGWSYKLDLTRIGIAVYVTMDISDIFLAFAKCVNYVNERWSAPPFAVFVAVWTYFRHYLNWWILWSTWAQFELIPEHVRNCFDPLNGRWIDWWLKWQMFGWIGALQIINLFWYILIWRVLLRALFSKQLSDERSDDEDDDESDKPKVE